MNTTPSPASRAAAVYLSTTPDCFTPRAAVGSSRISTRAPKYTARAIATHWRWPPESSPIGWLMSLTTMPIFCSSVSEMSRISSPLTRAAPHLLALGRREGKTDRAEPRAEEEVAPHLHQRHHREVLVDGRDAVVE